MLFLQSVGYMNPWHVRREVPGVTRDEDRAVHLRRREDEGIEQLHPRTVPDVRGGRGDPRVQLDHLERLDQLLNLRPAFERFAGDYLRPNDPADAVARIAEELRSRLRAAEQPVDNDIRVEKGIGHGGQSKVRSSRMASWYSNPSRMSARPDQWP